LSGRPDSRSSCRRCDRRRRGVNRLDTSTSDRDGNRDVATADTVAEYGESVTENYQPGRDCHGIPTACCHNWTGLAERPTDGCHESHHRTQCRARPATGATCCFRTCAPGQ
jgi:hypothetical protein